MFLGLLCFTASSVGIGLAISSMSKNMQQAIVFCFVFIIPMVILSGLVSPVENMPSFFQYITYLNPLRYALEVVHSVYLADAGIGHIKNEIIPMLIYRRHHYAFGSLGFPQTALDKGFSKRRLHLLQAAY